MSTRPLLPSSMRVARPVTQIPASLRFYVDILGLDQLGGFEGHNGYNGAFVGRAGSGAGDPDFMPTAEPRLARAMAIAYDMKPPPSAADIAEISEVWKPYRTWVALLLRIMLEEETH